LKIIKGEIEILRINFGFVIQVNLIENDALVFLEPLFSFFFLQEIPSQEIKYLNLIDL